MKSWEERSIEEANLLNPAFCCVVVASSIVGYSKSFAEGMPYPLVFITLPIILHKPTRDLLPPNTRTSLPGWIQDNQSVRILFYERVISLKSYTREALLFGFIHKWFTFNSDGNLQTLVTKPKIDKFLRQRQDESRECVMRANFLGKWLASAGSVSTVMALWGIQP
jgi:hypothetical protein